MSKMYYMKKRIELSGEGMVGYYKPFKISFDLIGFIFNDSLQFICLNERSTFMNYGMSGSTRLTIKFFNNVNDSFHVECVNREQMNKYDINNEFSDTYVKNNIGMKSYMIENYHFLNLKDDLLHYESINKNISLNRPYFKIDLDVGSPSELIEKRYYFDEIKDVSKFNEKFPLLVGEAGISTDYVNESWNQKIKIYKLTDDLYMANIYMLGNSKYRQYIQNDGLSVKLDFINNSKSNIYQYESRIFRNPDNDKDFSYIIMNDENEILYKQKIPNIESDDKKIFGIKDYILLPTIPKLIISGNITGNLGTFVDAMQITYNAVAADTKLDVDAYINNNKIYSDKCSIKDGKIIVNVSRAEVYKVGKNKENQKIKFVFSDSRGNKQTIEQTFNTGNINFNPEIKYSGLDNLGEINEPFKILFNITDVEKDTTKTYVTIASETYSLGNATDIVVEITDKMLKSLGSNTKNNTIKITTKDSKHSESVNKTITFDIGNL